jgi:lipopolysaccharide/colanic/teichoic acid biosynthesis glycosyltransferase
MGAGLMLLAMAAPLLAMIWIALRVTQGPEVFYRGVRIGRDGRLFNILKFRTLDNARAAALTKDQVLPDGAGLETKLGAFLRDTRLDELPQIWNVVRGDMNLVGPRPVRPSIAANCANTIPNYDRRFAVKPGLIGPTQAFMSHGADKSVRTRLNNLLITEPATLRGDVSLLAIVGSCVVARTFTELADRVVARLGRKPDKARRRAQNLRLELIFQAKRLYILRVGPDWMEISPPITGDGEGLLRITLPDGCVRAARIRIAASGTRMKYAAISHYSHHVVTRYVLEKVVTPHKSTLLLARIKRAALGERRHRKVVEAHV